MKRWSKMVVLSLVVGLVMLAAQARAQDATQPPAFKKEEIEQMVAPIALYPDSLVAQILMASTYPLEVVEAARWVKANPNVKDKALEEAMQKQTWDASVKSLTAFPQVIGMMNEKLDMTQKLGDAFLGQQKEVLTAIQVLRSKAQAAGNLKSGKEQTVSTAQEAGTTVIKIEPADPQTVYVPTYPPTVYGPWPYPSYPPYYYYPPGYVAGAALVGFTAAVIVGSALWGNCNWGRGDVDINVNKYNNFNKTNISNSNWNHNAEHRKGVQYRDSASQDKFGKGQRAGADTREAFRGRAEQGRQEIARGDADRLKGGGVGDRAGGGVGDRAGGGMGDRAGGGMGDRAGGGMGDRAGGGVQRTSGGGGSAFSGAGGGEARAQSNRGATSRASAGSFGGGGARAGGGGRGGGGGRR